MAPSIQVHGRWSPFSRTSFILDGTPVSGFYDEATKLLNKNGYECRRLPNGFEVWVSPFRGNTYKPNSRERRQIKKILANALHITHAGWRGSYNPGMRFAQ